MQLIKHFFSHTEILHLTTNSDQTYVNNLRKLDHQIFYSTNPYERKEHTFYWQLDQLICPHMNEQKNINSVKHIYICRKQVTYNFGNYFPNVIELTIKHYFETPDDSISTPLIE